MSAGFAQATIGEGLRASGVTASGAYGYNDLVSATLRQDALRARGTTLAATYVGVRLGTKPAIVGTVALAAAVAAIAAAFAGVRN